MRRIPTNGAARPLASVEGAEVDLEPSNTGTSRLERDRVSLAEICQQGIDEAALAFPGHPIEFERWDEAPGRWDRDRLLLVLRNLLSNAIDRAAPGRPVIVSVIQCSQEVLLAVANFGGRAIPAAFREQLLDPTSRGAGSGEHPGLSILKEIVRSHGGWIELTSDDSGTIFHVWLPNKQERTPSRE